MVKAAPIRPPSLFTFGDYERELINGMPFITGRPNFWPEPFGSLLPGMKVQKIGIPGKNGKPTSSSRIDTWTPNVTYMGTIFIGDFSNVDAQKCLGFQLPASGLTSNDPDRSFDSPYFALYGIINEEELLMPNISRGTIRIYRAVFTLEDGQITTGALPVNI